MSDYFGFPLQALDPEIRVIDGYIITANDGSVVNTATATAGVLDVDGDYAVFPKGISNVAVSTTGLYTVTLEQPFPKLLHAEASPVKASVIAGSMKLVKFNPTGAVNAEGTPARTVVFQYETSGSPANLGKGGFSLFMIIKNVKT